MNALLKQLAEEKAARSKAKEAGTEDIAAHPTIPPSSSRKRARVEDAEPLDSKALLALLLSNPRMRALKEGHRLLLQEHAKSRAPTKTTPQFSGQGHTLGKSAGTAGKSADSAIALDDSSDEDAGEVDAKPPRTSSDLLILSQNLWFDSLYPAERMRGLVKLLPSKRPDLLLLQEVTEFLRQPLSSALNTLTSTGDSSFFRTSASFSSSSSSSSSSTFSSSSSSSTPTFSSWSWISQPECSDSYGVAVVSNPSSLWSPVFSGTFRFAESRMCRGLTFSLLRHSSSKILILVGSTHLESWTPESDGSRLRASQCSELSSFVVDLCSVVGCDAAVVTGDYNWDDKKDSRGDGGSLLDVMRGAARMGGGDGGYWADAWLEWREKGGRTPPEDADGYTYDGGKNPMLAGGGLKKRFDRAMVYRPPEKKNGGGGRLRCVEVKIVNKVEIAPVVDLYREVGRTVNKVKVVKKVPVLVSDHFGLSLQVSFDS